MFGVVTSKIPPGCRIRWISPIICEGSCSRCSRKCETPDRAGVSSRAPTPTQIPNDTLRIAGTQFDDGARITRINDFRVDMQPAGTFLVVTHQDRPGVIAAISTLLARHDINIAGIELGRDRPRGHAVMLMEIDDPVGVELLEEVRETAMLDQLRQVRL